MSETILLIGFGSPETPAASDVGEGFRVEGLALPTDVALARERLAEAFARLAPSAVVTWVRQTEADRGLELALAATKGCSEGPAQVVSTLPLARTKLALEREGFATELDEEAGCELSNEVLYWLGCQDVPAGLLRVPTSMDEHELRRALDVVLRVTATKLSEQQVSV